MSTEAKQRSARQARELARRLNWLTEAQAALGWGVILFLVALLGVIYLSQASRIATVGRRVQILQNELTDLKRENAVLERAIAEAQSLDRLQQEAVRQGFVQAQPDDIEYVIVAGYPNEVGAQPLEPLLTATPIPTATPALPETMMEAVWWAVQASVGNLIRGEASE